jgi:putative transposase
MAHKDLHGIAMKKIYRILVGAMQKELARQIRYLKVENEVLRSKLPYRVPITNQERNRLVRFGAQLGTAINHLVSIVHPETL